MLSGQASLLTRTHLDEDFAMGCELTMTAPGFSRRKMYGSTLELQPPMNYLFCEEGESFTPISYCSFYFL